MRSTPSSAPSRCGRRSTSRTARSGWACRAADVDLVHAAERTIRRHAMLAGGETVLIGVSGGADSVALLHVLLRLAGALDLRLHVLHVDHGLRPDSARDAEFVRALGARLGVPVDVVGVRVGAGWVEAAARAARHAALETAADRVGAARIALGHTADDQAETLVMRLLEGTGVRGLAGIPTVRGRLIRPLLESRHRDAVAALRAAGMEWLEDPSNRDPRFFRNRVRHGLLPRLAEETGGDLVARLGRLARRAREAVDALDHVAAVELSRLAREEDGALVLSRSALAALPRPVAAEILRAAAASLGSRAPRRGDRFRPFGGGDRRLKSFLIDAKVPRWDRDRLPLVDAGRDILWVAGVRRGAAAPVTARTGRVVELRLVPLARRRPAAVECASP